MPLSPSRRKARRSRTRAPPQASAAAPPADSHRRVPTSRQLAVLRPACPQAPPA
nr:MAG TPA: hypothetical protein [Caudoviricetes sp.]